MERSVPARLSPAAGRRFGLTLGCAFLVIGGISFWRGHQIAPIALWLLGWSLIAAGVSIPGHLGPIYRSWMGLAQLLSKLTTPIIMGLIYFAVLTPIGLIRRLLGHNAMVRPQGDSFWITREPGTKRRSELGRQF